MQLQNAHEFLHASPIRPCLSEVSKHLVVSHRPAFAPLFEWFGVIKGPRSLFEQWQIVQGIKEILLTLITTRMSGKQLKTVPDLNEERIGGSRVTCRRARSTGTE